MADVAISDPEEPYRLAIVNSHPIQYFAPLYRQLAREPDIDLTVYYCSRHGADRYVDKGFGQSLSWDVPLVDGYSHLFVPNLRGERNPSGFWSLVNVDIVSALLRQRYDAVLIHGHNYAAYLLSILGAKLGDSQLFLRCDTHLGLDRPLVRRVLRKPVMTMFYTLFDACLAIGTRNATFYRHHGVRENRIVHVPYSVDNDFFRERSHSARIDPDGARKELGLPTGGVPLVLYVSKFTERKRPMDLLRAFRRLREQADSRAALVFVGAGSENERLREFADRQGIPDVHFLGFRNQSELPAIYGASDVFVLPSENEPWGLVVNEAMAVGLPVVVSDGVGAARDLVDEGSNGFVVPVGDVATLAERLGRLTEDSELRRRMGATSREIIGDWSFEASIAGIRAALRTACARKVNTR